MGWNSVGKLAFNCSESKWFYRQYCKKIYMNCITYVIIYISLIEKKTGTSPDYVELWSENHTVPLFKFGIKKICVYRNEKYNFCTRIPKPQWNVGFVSSISIKIFLSILHGAWGRESGLCATPSRRHCIYLVLSYKRDGWVISYVFMYIINISINYLVIKRYVYFKDEI